MGKQSMDKAKLVLTVNRLMTIVTEEERWISLDAMVRDPEVKDVIIFGRGGIAWDAFQEKN